MTDTMVPGEVTVRVYEASRIKSLNIFDKQSAYVKVKHNGMKSRTRATLGGTAPTWKDDDENVLRMEVEDVNTDLSIEVWNESKHKKNSKIDSVVIPVEPYARTHGPATPKWHKLGSQGSLLFSVDFQPSPTSMDAFKSLEKLAPKRAIDPTTVQQERKYHPEEARDEVHYGDDIAMHALGGRFMKYGSCLRTHFQKEKKCLQLTKTFDKQTQLRITGDESECVLTYGDRFHLNEIVKGTRVHVGTESFELLPLNDEKKRGDDVMYGDAVYLQAIYEKSGTEILGAEGESLHVFDPTIYVSSKSPKIAFTITYHDGLLKKPKAEPAAKLELKLTTYNVWMMPDKITTFADVSPLKCERASLIADALPESDVVIFNEAFCHTARPVLLEAMKEEGYYFESPVVGHLVGRAQTKFLDGGVVVVSKYPIEKTDVMRFGGVCHGDDALADKGVVYASILKDGRRVHVFASHTQAWTSPIAVKTRQDQFRMMRHFVDEMEIPANEPVIVAGDFNVNKLLNDENNECTEMINILECDEPEAAADQTTTASFDAEHNPLAADGPSSDGVNERLDFILTCQHHLKPTSAMVKINPIKAREAWHWASKNKDYHDLSDHYPVTSKFEFEYN